jgi:ribosome recycling factor
MDFKTQAEANMKARIEKLKGELMRVRTGRANPQILDGVRVEYYGQLVPLKQVAAVSAPDARTLEVRPWDQGLLGEVEKAIVKADLGLSPKREEQLVRILLPAMTEERRKDLVKFVGKIAEEFRVGIRNDRRDALELVKKAAKEKKISEDEQKVSEGLVQKLTDSFIKAVEDAAASKAREITTL